jgi:hypothetical protein
MKRIKPTPAQVANARAWFDLEIWRIRRTVFGTAVLILIGCAAQLASLVAVQAGRLSLRAGVLAAALSVVASAGSVGTLAIGIAHAQRRDNGDE